MLSPVIVQQKLPQITSHTNFISDKSFPNDLRLDSGQSSSNKRSLSKRSSLKSTILVQTRPMIDSQENNSLITPGPIDMYNTNNLTVVSEPNRSTEANNDEKTLHVINTVPSMKSLPSFVYQNNNNTGLLNRYLAIEYDKSYKPDPDFGPSQEWLLYQHQGDQYDRLPERVSDPIIADAESYNEQGFTLLNRGRIWYGPPREQKDTSGSKYYEEYKKYIEYGHTQIEEQAY